MKLSIELILVIVVMLASKLGLNSKNSRIAPSKDINREKQTKDKSDKPACGQKGRTVTNKLIFISFIIFS